MDDDELIAALAAGDDTALRELFTRHAPWLAARLRAALPPPDVEDVLQETFLAVWRGARGHRPHGTPQAWIWVIARNQAALLLRNRGPLTAALEDLPQTGADPAETAAVRADIAAALSGPEGDVLRLMYVEDRPVAEVAARLLRSPGLARALVTTPSLLLPWLISTVVKEMPPAAVPRAVAAAVERVDLGVKAKAKLRTLSGGMLRRVGIAQAIVNDPDLLLLDEPTAGLDPEQRVQFRALMRDFGMSATVIVSTHLVEDVGAACAEVALMSDGKIVFRGTPDELTARGEGHGVGDAPLERGYSAVLSVARLSEAQSGAVTAS